MIELLRTKDINEVLELHKEIFCEEFPIEEFLKKKQTRDLIIYILSTKDSIVGFAIISDQKEKENYHFWIGGMLPCFQQKGYCGEFLDEMVKMARLNKYKSVTLSSYNHRPKMLRLAIKKGFKIIGTEKGQYGDSIKILFKYFIIPQKELRISLTNACNFNCFFCHGEGLDLCDSLSKDKLEKILIQAKKNKYQSITFTGGEPTINRDELCFAIEHCNEFEQKPNLKIVTNGSLVDLEFIRMIQKYKGKIKLNLSFHSIKKDTFDKITQREEYFEKVLQCIKVLQKEEIDFRINYVVLKEMNDSEDDLEKLISYCLNNKIEQVTFLELLVTQENKHLFKYFLDYESIKKQINLVCKNVGEVFIEYENEKKIRYRLIAEKQTMYLEVFKLTCRMGCQNCVTVKDKTIGSDGEYYPCFVQSNQKCGNACEDMEGAFIEGDEIIKEYAKVYGNSSPIITE